MGGVHSLLMTDGYPLSDGDSEGIETPLPPPLPLSDLTDPPGEFWPPCGCCPSGPPPGAAGDMLCPYDPYGELLPYIDMAE